MLPKGHGALIIGVGQEGVRDAGVLDGHLLTQLAPVGSGE